MTSRKVVEKSLNFKNSFWLQFQSFCCLIFYFEVSFDSKKFTHANGYKADISQNECLNNYIVGKYPKVGQTSQGPIYKNTKSGDIYVKKSHLNQPGRHWDITANDGSTEFANLKIPVTKKE